MSLAAALAAAVVAGCGQATPTPHEPAKLPVKPMAAKPKVSVDTDPEAAASFALPAGVRGTRLAPSPAAAPAAHRIRAQTQSGISPGAPSDDEVRAELKEMDRVLRRWRHSVRAPVINSAGHAEVPAGLPDVVARIIAGGNAIARFPYVWGGGHGSFIDTGYDCSGSVSYALAAAGLLDRPLTSGQLAHWGAPGRGHYITIYANAGHTFMYVDGLRFDTSGRAGAFGSRWQTAPRTLAGFSVRHPPGL